MTCFSDLTLVIFMQTSTVDYTKTYCYTPFVQILTNANLYQERFNFYCRVLIAHLFGTEKFKQNILKEERLTNPEFQENSQRRKGLVQLYFILTYPRYSKIVLDSPLFIVSWSGNCGSMTRMKCLRFNESCQVFVALHDFFKTQLSLRLWDRDSHTIRGVIF